MADELIREENLLEILPHAVYECDADGKITIVNTSYERITGYSKDELIGMHVWDLMEPGAQKDSLPTYLKQLVKEKIPPTSYVSKNLTKGGKIIDVQVDWTYKKDEKGKVVGFACILADISMRKQAEEALRKSGERYRSLVEHTNDAIFCYEYAPPIPNDLPVEEQIRLLYSGKLVECNLKTAQYYGYGSVEDVLGKKLSELFSAEHGGPVDDLFRKYISNGYRTFDGVGVEELPDGSKRYFQNNAYGVIIANEHVRTWGTFHDITEHKKAEEELLKQRYFLSKAQEIGNIGTWELDIKENILVWTDETYRIFGLPIESELTYETFLDCVHPDDREYVDREWKAAFDKKPYDIEHRLLMSDGTVKWVREKAELDFDEQENCLRGTGFTQDITKRKQTEKQLSQYHQHLEELVKERTYKLKVEVVEHKLAKEKLKNAFSEIEKLKNQLQADNIYLQEEIKSEYDFDEIIGQSDAIKYVLYKAEQVGSGDTTVLLLGETGTGKELVARAIHNLSPRKVRPLIKVNCATIPSSLIESELFGHEKGAFTGADHKQLGRFEIANGSTLFLDEIGELPLELQAKLLRVIQDGEFERLGSHHTHKTDVRIIAATNRNLEEEIKNKQFRKDLYYRLKVFPISIPPLRQRKEDIPLLVKAFTNRFANKLRKSIKTIPQHALDTLQKHSWPGNVRELESVIERAVINTQGSVLQIMDMLEIYRDTDTLSPQRKNLEEVERDYILQVLEEVSWKVEGKDGAAIILGLNPSTLRGRMRKLAIHRS